MVCINTLGRIPRIGAVCNYSTRVRSYCHTDVPSCGIPYSLVCVHLVCIYLFLSKSMNKYLRTQTHIYIHKYIDVCIHVSNAYICTHVQKYVRACIWQTTDDPLTETLLCLPLFFSVTLMISLWLLRKKLYYIYMYSSDNASESLASNHVVRCDDLYFRCYSTNGSFN